jgi:hypothetical protein
VVVVESRFLLVQFRAERRWLKQRVQSVQCRGASPMELVTSSRVAVAEAQGLFRNLESGERPPLEAVSRGLVKTQQTEKA